MKRAIVAGRLAPLDGQVCRDCGAPATQYDHRDYAKPLDVVPVCVTCNRRRGPAHTRLTRAKRKVLHARAAARAHLPAFTHAIFLQQLRDSLELAKAEGRYPHPKP